MTILIQANERKYKVDLSELNTNQQKFVYELIADDLFNPTAAARRAGYKNPAIMANKLMKNPTVALALGKVMRERNERCEMKAAHVMEYIRHALFFNPLDHFIPTDEGGVWLVEDPSAIPPEIGQLIESMEIKHLERPDGSQMTMFKVKLVSKTAILGHALRHMDAGMVEPAGEAAFDWDKLYAQFGDDGAPNVIEA